MLFFIFYKGTTNFYSQLFTRNKDGTYVHYFPDLGLVVYVLLSINLCILFSLSFKVHFQKYYDFKKEINNSDDI